MANSHIYAPLQKLAAKTTLTLAAFSAASSVAAQGVAGAENTAADQSPAAGKITPDLIVRAPDQFMAALEKVAGMPVLPVDLSGLKKPGPAGEPAIRAALQQAAAARGWDVADTQRLLQSGWASESPFFTSAVKAMAGEANADAKTPDERNPAYFSAPTYYPAETLTTTDGAATATKRVCIIGMDAPWHAPSRQIDKMAEELLVIAGPERAAQLSEPLLKHTLRSFALLHEAGHCNEPALYPSAGFTAAYDKTLGRLTSSFGSYVRRRIHNENTADQAVMAALDHRSFPDFPHLFYSFRTFRGLWTAEYNTQFSPAEGHNPPRMTVPEIAAGQQQISRFVLTTMGSQGEGWVDRSTIPVYRIAGILVDGLTSGKLTTPEAQLYAQQYVKAAVPMLIRTGELPSEASKHPLVAEPASPATPSQPSRAARGVEGMRAP